MEWANEVHEHRYAATIAQARQEYRMKKRGYKVEVGPTGNLAAVAGFVALAGSAFWWTKEGHKLRGRNWRNMPVIKQVLDFMSNGDDKSLAKPSGSAGAAAGKAAVARQQAREAAREQKAAATAASAKQQQQQQQQQQQSASNSSKKKKNKKKK